MLCNDAPMVPQTLLKQWRLDYLIPGQPYLHEGGELDI